MKHTSPQTDSAHASFESRISAAIEQQPAPLIPVDFATRVAARAMEMPKRSPARRVSYARATSIFFSALLVLALFVLAPHARPSFNSISFDLEMTALVLLAGFTYWLTPARRNSF